MSILIKGIDLPKDDDYIVLEIEKNGTVEAYSSTFGEVDGDPIAIQIDRPHGRLIDGVELIKTITENAYIIKHGYNEAEYGMSCFGIMQAIYDAPTILEAEE